MYRHCGPTLQDIKRKHEQIGKTPKSLEILGDRERGGRLVRLMPPARLLPPQLLLRQRGRTDCFARNFSRKRGRIIVKTDFRSLRKAVRSRCSGAVLYKSLMSSKCWPAKHSGLPSGWWGGWLHGYPFRWGVGAYFYLKNQFLLLSCIRM